MSRFLVLGVLLLLPVALAGDSISVQPGQKLVPCEIILETGEEARDYQFWLRSRLSLELLPLVPGQPYRIQGRKKSSRDSTGCLIAAPRALIDQMGAREFYQALESHRPVPGSFRTGEELKFYTFISTRDKRTSVIEKYRLDIDATSGLRLRRQVLPGDNAPEDTANNEASNEWLGGALVVIGVFISGLIMWLGLRLARRGRQSQPATG